jgi:hypothetical protein
MVPVAWVYGLDVRDGVQIANPACTEPPGKGAAAP